MAGLSFSCGASHPLPVYWSSAGSPLVAPRKSLDCTFRVFSVRFGYGRVVEHSTLDVQHVPALIQAPLHIVLLLWLFSGVDVIVNATLFSIHSRWNVTYFCMLRCRLTFVYSYGYAQTAMCCRLSSAFPFLL